MTYFIKSTALLLVLLYAGYFAGCSGDQPVGPAQPTPDGLLQGVWGWSNPTCPPQLGRVDSTTKLITVAGGGTLNIGFTVNNGPRAFPTQVQVSLKFPPGAVTQNCYVTMKVNEYNLETGIDLGFGPHGMVFKTPALLNINTLNFNVNHIASGGGPNFINVDDGTPQAYESLRMIPWNGKITLLGAKIPHFSRYAFIRW